jgi:hypothetical protein
MGEVIFLTKLWHLAHFVGDGHRRNRHKRGALA